MVPFFSLKILSAEKGFISLQYLSYHFPENSDLIRLDYDQIKKKRDSLKNRPLSVLSSIKEDFCHSAHKILCKTKTEE